MLIDFNKKKENQETEPYLIPMAADLYEDDEKFIIVVDCPGTTKDKLNLEISDDEIVVSRDEDIDVDTSMDEIIRERRYEYKRVIRLSSKIETNPDSVAAKYENGCLYISAIKAEENKGIKVVIK